jgi:hypothetical protein
VQEERRFEPSVPLAVKTLLGHTFRRPLVVRQPPEGHGVRGCLGADEVRGPRDHRQPGRTDELAEIAGAIGQSQATAGDTELPVRKHTAPTAGDSTKRYTAKIPDTL